MITHLFRNKSPSYLVRDEFSSALTAGSVNGTLSVPGPGARVVTDTNSKISLANGSVSFATAAAVSDGLWSSVLLARVAGRFVRSRITRPDTTCQPQLGLDTNQAGNPICGFMLASDDLYAVFNNVTLNVGLVAAATYDLALVMRPNGLFYFIKGDTYTKWTLVWMSLLLNEARYPGLVARTATSPFTAEFLYTSRRLVQVKPRVYDLFSSGHLYDDFSRADGAPGTALSGQVYALVPAGQNPAVVEASISSNKLVAADSGQSTTAAYTGIDLGAGVKPFRMSARIVFSAGTASGSAVLVSNAQGLGFVTQITSGSIHIVFTSTYCNITIWKPAYTVLHTYYNPTPCVRDGATQYDIGWRLSGDTLTIEAPDGTEYSYTSEWFQKLLGRYCTFEHYWSTGQCQPSILKAQVEADTSDSLSYDGWTIDRKSWTDRAGVWGRSAGQAKAVALVGGIAVSTVPCSTADVLVECQVTHSSGNAGLVARYADASNYIYAIHNGTNVQLIKVVAGTPTTLIDTAATYSASARLVLVLSGTKARVFYNEAVVGTEQTIDDAALQAAGDHGLYTSNLANTFDAFSVWPRGSAGEYEGLF